MDWPLQSPDMNPIENRWRDLKIAVRRYQPTSKAHLKAVLQDEWQRIAPERCQKLVNSMPSRISAVIRAKGLCTNTSNYYCDIAIFAVILISNDVFSYVTCYSIYLMILYDYFLGIIEIYNKNIVISNYNCYIGFITELYPHF